MRRGPCIVASSPFYFTSSCNRRLVVTDCSKLEWWVWHFHLWYNSHTKTNENRYNYYSVIVCQFWSCCRSLWKNCCDHLFYSVFFVSWLLWSHMQTRTCNSAVILCVMYKVWSPFYLAVRRMIRNAYNILVREPRGVNLLKSRRHRFENNINGF